MSNKSNNSYCLLSQRSSTSVLSMIRQAQRITFHDQLSQTVNHITEPQWARAPALTTAVQYLPPLFSRDIAPGVVIFLLILLSLVSFAVFLNNMFWKKGNSLYRLLDRPLLITQCSPNKDSEAHVRNLSFK